MSARSERLRLAIVSALHSVQGTAHHLPQGTLTVLAERLTQALTPLVSEVGEKATAPAATATPQFFQPGRTYTDGNGYRAPELTTLFRVEHITRHPDRGHLRAIGWSRTGEPGAKWHGDFRDEGEFDGWSEVGGSDV